LISGVLCPSAFPHRTGGNSHLTHHTLTPTLSHRIIAFHEPTTQPHTAHLLQTAALPTAAAQRSRGASLFIALPGSIGTLTELIVSWQLAIAQSYALPREQRATLQVKPCIVAWRKPWQSVVAVCVM
jgi:hypothetical protein